MNVLELCYCDARMVSCCAMTDTVNLLYFLRTAKFSQLRARTLIENYAKAATGFPHWFRDIDTHDPDTLEVIESGLAASVEAV